MGKWRILERGDVVDIIAPSWSSTSTELRAGIKILKSWGLKPRYSEDMISPDFVYANSLEYRVEKLKKALKSKTSKAIFTLRGGSGAQALVPYLDKITPPEQIKPFIGLSDITSLHNFFFQEWGWPTLHGVVLTRLGNKRTLMREKRELQYILFGKSKEQEFSGLKPLNSAAKKSGRVSGKVVGGNLKVLEATLGTAWSFQSRNRIVFLEDVNERGYSIDRMFEHFYQAGAFRGCRAVVFGDFVGGAEKDGKSLVQKALVRFAERVKFPVLKGVAAGHGRLQRTVPLGVSSVLSTGKKSKWICDSGGKGRG